MPNDSTERKTFRAKEGIVFLRQEMGRIRKIKRKATYIANGQAAPNCILLRSRRHRDLWGGSGCASDPKTDPLLSTFPSAIFSFWERIVNFKDFGGQISHFTKKMRRTKGQRWDKVGLSRMRDEVSSRLTIRRKAKCIKCERNDNMGDRPIHNSLIILKCLLGRYRIDNLSNE